MKTIEKCAIVLVCLTAGWLSEGCASAQTYGQRDYGQPGYNQPYDQPGSNQPGYNQPGYDQSYNQGGYDQQYGQSPDFYTELNQYGQWVQTPQYGRVWIPNAGPNFQPYATNGHWVVTEYGNTWVSDYTWGWAPFHYGRWYQDPYRGWAWVPGNVWGPAWVSWRSGGGYYGWAPLGPGGNSYGNVNMPAPYWTFVPQMYITSPRIYSYYVPQPRVVNIYQQTTIINNVYRVNNRDYAYGPRREDIERVTRQRVPVYQVENADRPGRAVVQNNTVNIYRPNADRNTGYNGNSGNGNNSGSNNNSGYGNSRGSGSGYGNRPRGSSVQENNPNPGTYNGGPRDGAPRENAPNPGSYGGQSRGNGADIIQSGPGNSRPRVRTSSPDATPSSPQPYPSNSGSRGRGSYYGQPAEPVQTAPQPAPANPPSEPAQSPVGRSFPQAEPRETRPEVQRSRGADIQRSGSEQPTYQPRTSVPRQNNPSVEPGLPAPVREQGGFRQRSEQPVQPTQQPATDPAPTLERRGGSRGPR